MFNPLPYLARRPLVTLALAAVVGILIGGVLPAGWFTLAAAGGLAVVALIVTAIRLCAGLPALALTTALVFATLHLVTRQTTEIHPLRTFLEHRDPMAGLTVTAAGRVEKALRRDLPGNVTREEYFVATEITSPTLGRQWTGPTVLRLVTGGKENLPPGKYQVTGFIRLPPLADNPGQFNERVYDLRLGLVAELRGIEIHPLALDRWNLDAWLVSAAERCRAWVEQALKIDLENAPEEYAVIVAMALGTVQSDAADLQTPFRNSGTLHIFSVSGLHVAIVGFILWKLLKAFGLRRGALLAVLIPVLFGYAFITGLRPSAVRAAVMASVFLCGALFHRKGDLMNSLGGSAVLLLAYDTQQLYAPGFQLSFAVLGAIALLAGPFTRPFLRWVNPDPFIPQVLLTPSQQWAWEMRKQLVGLFTVSGAAWVGSLPLTLGHFQLATPVALLANVVLVPLSFCVLFAAVLTLLSAAAHLTAVQALFSNANWLMAWLTMKSAVFFASLPGGNFHIAAPWFEETAPAELVVLRMPESAAVQHLRAGSSQWLLDTGSAKDLRYLLQPYLAYRGVDRLDGVMLSHNDIQHAGAASQLWQSHRPPLYHHAATEPWRWDASNTAFKKLRSSTWPGQALQRGDKLTLGGSEGVEVTAEVLYPPAQLWSRRADDRALVIRLCLGPHRVLWCGDSGFLAEKALLENFTPDQLKSDVLIRNQHASDTVFLPEFVAAVAPKIVISSSQNFPAGQLLPEHVRQTCREQGILLLDQSRTGAVRLKAWAEKLEITPYLIPAEMVTLFPTSGG
ncbi:ComEC/Rec2 family competence protein [Verrucomicrobium sp. BvORR106]|uniref:ComEC/Rec2 family competence protein n=1 Tax=Verrucomicrobium sp. BvORR106 TaxID=1403819 RepID=UPI0005717E2B|nr:ComEC/Rec2 family competence protein [Verrucomicrobium sp. BvORR106]